MISDFDDNLLLHALADRALGEATSSALEKRLAAEPALAAAYDRINTVKHLIGRLERPVVSPEFHDRMAALATPAVIPFPSRPRAPAMWRGGDWRALAASVVLTAFLASSSTYVLTKPPGDMAVEDAIIGGHRRSLLATSTVDVVSSDRHTVRPWFDAKLGISPPTPNLSGIGFPLIGGRVDVVGGKTVPTLVYSHGKHLISVVAVPDMPGEAADRGPRAGMIAGYNVARWTQGGFHYWAVSDLDAAELDILVRDLRSK